MATASIVRCTKCAKNAGTITCEGCSAKFCRRCFDNHRQDLSKELDNIVYEHDMLKQELEKPNENGTHPLLKQIDNWRKESIDKINQLADRCRTDVVKLIDDNKNQLVDRFRKITNTIRDSRSDENYDDRHLKMWITQLKELKDELIKPSNVHVEVDKQQPSWIQKIIVREGSHQQEEVNDSKL
ncbi:unnamed protein product [Didymodactylos carnosus]|uniref:B box-type domain-containing protein n=1 Tax=Didymodactylos carnosus TaxID=1234261 RepID=A0A815UTZ8_9BILA|nr:unnamed protein product [Didymodactylos carnosus]CAF1520613.1 unnamed protein product [Didymodactylos carnosus]CAF4178951.1 unnamed protein product [Didymodactylos carnosus]CAF4380069.1 unnamed protein product [Didymodactylos carnosus]